MKHIKKNYRKDVQLYCVYYYIFYQASVGSHSDDSDARPHELPGSDVLSTPRERSAVLVHDRRGVYPDLDVVRHVRERLRNPAEQNKNRTKSGP